MELLPHVGLRARVFIFFYEGVNMFTTLDSAARAAGAGEGRPLIAGRWPVSESPQTRLSLLERLRDAGDSRAWEEFVDLYAPLVYRLGRRYGLQDADVADLTQEVLGVATRSLPTFRYDAERGSFRGWLLAVARNLLSRLCRQRQKQLPACGDSAVQALLQQRPAPDENEQWEHEYRQRLFECAAELVRDQFRPNTWNAFWRTAVTGEDAATVAGSLGLSVGAVYIARSRVLARVREEIQRLDQA